MRVMVVDDSAFMRRAIGDMLASDPEIEVIHRARNGKEAVEKAIELAPDLITLDIEMPEMDGLTALRLIRVKAKDPKPAILMCSSLTTAGSHEALKALALGASDVIAKDHSTFSSNIDAMRDDLIAKVKAIGKARQRRALRVRTPAAPGSQGAVPPISKLVAPMRGASVIVVGSSTGGPPALEKLLAPLPADLPVPIVVAQHMPALFTKSLAERLDSMSNLSVIQADRTMKLSPGVVHIIVGGKHGRVIKGIGGDLQLRITDQPADARYKPSVDELLASAAETVRNRAIAVVLTGMGDDGALGAAKLKVEGSTVLAQDEASSVVYGMPRAVADAGSASGEGSPEQLGEFLARLSRGVRAA